MAMLVYRRVKKKKLQVLPKLQGQRDQGCRADGKALSNGRCGVAGGIQGIGAAAHFRIEQGHLLATKMCQIFVIQKDRIHGKKQTSNKKVQKLFKNSTLWTWRPADVSEIATAICA